jgi:cytochrome c biogenesis protein CcmG, thiol:disulfide interchange protein DsbE
MTADGTPWGMIIAIVLLAVAFWLFMTRQVPQPATHPAVGRQAPQLDLVQLIPETIAEGDDPAAQTQGPLRLSGLPQAGVVTLIHFWGTWCPPCKLEYPELVEMAAALQSEPRFEFVTISCSGGQREDYADLQTQTRRYYQSIGAGELTTFADLDGETRRSASEQLSESMVYPMTILVAPDQRIAGVWMGYSPAGVDEMRQAATELLQRSP